MKTKLLFALSLLFFGLNAVQAQNTTNINGKITTKDNKALASITLMLLKAADSSLVKTEVTNSDGMYNFKAIPAGSYFINTSSVAHQDYYSTPFNVSNTDIAVPTITLSDLSKALDGVTVVAKKPMVQVKADKMVVNVEGTINAQGNNGIELLRKSPGIIIDKDDNISMAGKNGVRIYIDGRPSPLNGTDLAAYLKSIQSSQVESIELITSPGAKYEAEGNAGIINIKLKKNKSFGTNGSVNAGYAVGVYGKYDLGINLNNRNKKTNIFGSANVNHNLYDNEFNLQRYVVDTSFINTSKMLPLSTNVGYKVGFDYYANSKSTFGVLINGNLSTSDFKNFSETPIAYVPTNVVSRYLVAANETKGKNNNINVNGNYKYSSNGKDLNIDIDYGRFDINNDQLQPNTYFNATKTAVLSRADYKFISPTKIDITALKVDYEMPVNKTGKLGFGGKFSYTNANNHFERYDVVGNTKTLDVPRSNEFIYKENINALYANYNGQIKEGMQFQLGLRAENTNATGDTYGLFSNGQVNTASKNGFKRNYTNLFPSAAITFNKNPMKQWTIAYSRRIDRPAYQDLNPFEFKLDEYTFQKGNTALVPQYTNNVTITNVHKYMLTTSLSFSEVKNVFTSLIDTAEISKSFITKKNLATQKIVSLNISYPFQKKWYSAFFNLNSFFSNYKADFGGGSRVVNLDVFTAQFYSQHSFTLNKKGLVAEVSGFATTPTVWEGTFKTNALWSVDAGISKPVLKGNGTLKLAVSDIFRSLVWRGELNFTGQRTVASGYNESRQFKINFSYRFGSAAIKAARQRASATEDEKNRTKRGGGLGG